MAGDWIKIRAAIFTDPKMLAMAESLLSCVPFRARFGHDESADGLRNARYAPVTRDSAVRDTVTGVTLV